MGHLLLTAMCVSGCCHATVGGTWEVLGSFWNVQDVNIVVYKVRYFKPIPMVVFSSLYVVH